MRLELNHHSSTSRSRRACIHLSTIKICTPTTCILSTGPMHSRSMVHLGIPWRPFHLFCNSCPTLATLLRMVSGHHHRTSRHFPTTRALHNNTQKTCVFCKGLLYMQCDLRLPMLAVLNLNLLQALAMWFIRLLSHTRPQ